MNRLKIQKNKKAARADADTFERVLGNAAAVKELGRFENESGELLDLIALNVLDEYITKEEFTKEQFIAFREGVEIMRNAFTACKYEAQSLHQNSLDSK